MNNTQATQKEMIQETLEKIANYGFHTIEIRRDAIRTASYIGRVEYAIETGSEEEVLKNINLLENYCDHLEEMYGKRETFDEADILSIVKHTRYLIEDLRE